MRPIGEVVIVGMGALGILFGEPLTEALGPGRVVFLGDEKRVERFRKDGVYSNGRRCPFAMATPREWKAKGGERPPRLILFAVKSTALKEAVELARPLVEEDTILVSLLNGVTSEEYLEQSLGKGTVIYCVAQGMDAVKEENRLTFSHRGQLVIGIPKEEPEKRPQLEAVKAFFGRAGVPYTEDPDIRRRLWSKWTLNVGVNQVVMVEEGTYGTIQRPGEPRDRMKAAMREALRTAQAEGVAVTEQDLEDYVALVDTLSPEGMPSMRQDGLAGRATEVELFAGTVIQKAEKHGLEVPVNRELYRRVKELERRAENAGEAEKKDFPEAPPSFPETEEALWRWLTDHQGQLFYTATGLPFAYAIHGGEIIVDRRAKTITRATVAQAQKRLLEDLRQKEAGALPRIVGPKSLNCFGAPYIWALFLAMGYPADSFPQKKRGRKTSMPHREENAQAEQESTGCPNGYSISDTDIVE